MTQVKAPGHFNNLKKKIHQFRHFSVSSQSALQKASHSFTHTWKVSAAVEDAAHQSGWSVWKAGPGGGRDLKLQPIQAIQVILLFQTYTRKRMWGLHDHLLCFPNNYIVRTEWVVGIRMGCLFTPGPAPRAIVDFFCVCDRIDFTQSCRCHRRFLQHPHFASVAWHIHQTQQGIWIISKVLNVKLIEKFHSFHFTRLRYAASQ